MLVRCQPTKDALVPGVCICTQAESERVGDLGVSSREIDFSRDIARNDEHSDISAGAKDGEYVR